MKKTFIAKEIRVNGVAVGRTIPGDLNSPLKITQVAELEPVPPVVSLQLSVTRVLQRSPALDEFMASFGWVCGECGNGSNDPTVHTCLECKKPR